MQPPELVLVGLLIAIGLVGVVVPLLPGLLMVWAAVLLWAVVEQEPLAWTVLVLATVLVAVAQVVKYLLPGRRLAAAGVPNRTLFAGAALGVVGFFVVPVVGLLIGFVLGVYLAERLRLGAHAGAWESTKHALKAAGLSILIELAAGLIVALAWLGAVAAG